MANYCFGIDIGGTTVKTGLFTDKGELVFVNQIKTRTEENGSYILKDIEYNLKNIITERNIRPEEIMGIGVGVPGPVNPDGEILGCVNLGWQTMKLDGLSEHFYGVKVYPLNDANGAALGEMWKGSGLIDGKMTRDLAFITLGTGVGGGLICNGKLISGSTGGAGEIGHFPVNFHEESTCNCGKKGCLEQYCSATGVVRMAKKMIKECNEDITAKEIFDLAKEGKEEYMSVVELFCEYLAKGCAYIASATNPKMIVIGGGVSAAGTIITQKVEKYFKKYAFKPCSDVTFAIAKLGNDAGMYGCAYTVLNNTSVEMRKLWN